jgi:hypothetical protein
MGVFCFGDRMKEIQLTQGKVTIVDDDTYEWASQVKWYVQRHHRGAKVYYYVARSQYVRSTKAHLPVIYLHRLVLGLYRDDPVEVDHINHDTLDNRACNLRACTTAENQRNSVNPKGSSIYRGVCWHKNNHLWQVQININGRRKYLGNFHDEKEAAISYDNAAKVFHGEFAQLNFPAPASRRT